MASCILGSEQKRMEMLTCWITVISIVLISANPTEKPTNIYGMTALSESTTKAMWIKEANATDADNIYTTTESDTDTKKPHKHAEMLAVYAVVGALGILGNALTVMVMLSSKKLRKSFTNWFIINQSVLDLLAAIMLLGFTSDHRVTLPPGLAGELLCKFWYSELVLWGMFANSTYNLVLLTFERYCKVVHPIFHRNNFTKRQAVVLCLIVWTFGPIYHIIILSPVSHVIDGECKFHVYPSEFIGHLVAAINSSFDFFIPLVMMIYCYTTMAWKLKKRGQLGLLSTRVATIAAALQDPTKSGPKQKQLTSNEKAQKSSIKTLAIVAGAFIFCWSWRQIFFFLQLGRDVDFDNSFYRISIIAVFLNCCVNPFIYAFQYK